MKKLLIATLIMTAPLAHASGDDHWRVQRTGDNYTAISPFIQVLPKGACEGATFSSGLIGSGWIANTLESDITPTCRSYLDKTFGDYNRPNKAVITVDGVSMKVLSFVHEAVYFYVPITNKATGFLVNELAKKNAITVDSQAFGAVSFTAKGFAMAQKIAAQKNNHTL